MVPSEDDIKNFVSITQADDGKAFVFLEVSSHKYREIQHADEKIQGADSVDEAVGQFFENPDKYTAPPAPSSPNAPVANAAKNAQSQAPAYSPPPYAPPANINGSGGPRRRPHTNPVIEAGHVRARDEVRFDSYPV